MKDRVSNRARRLPPLLLLAMLAACAEPSTGIPTGIATGEPTPGAWIGVSAGTYNSCALASDGSPHCWGFALVESCSASGCAFDAAPKRIAGSVPRFVSLDGGGGFHCGTTAAGEAYCWGEIFDGSLGDGVTRRSAAPVRVAVPGAVRAVATGYGHACALTDTGAVYCWRGSGAVVGVAAGSIATPRRIDTDLTFTAISAGTTQTCAIASNSDAYCWGGGYGTLGAGARDPSCTIAESCLVSAVPLLVDGGHRWKSISAGNAFTCGVTVDARGYCWGAVQHREDPNPPLGVLGTGAFTGSKSPVPVTGGHAFTSITTGTRQACGLTVEGAALCWGSNEMGELGIGRAGGREAAPQRVAGGLRFSALTASEISCGLEVAGTLYCWGPTTAGALGNGVSSVGLRSAPDAVLPPASAGE